MEWPVNFYEMTPDQQFEIEEALITGGVEVFIPSGEWETACEITRHNYYRLKPKPENQLDFVDVDECDNIEVFYIGIYGYERAERRRANIGRKIVNVADEGLEACS